MVRTTTFSMRFLSRPKRVDSAHSGSEADDNEASSAASDPGEGQDTGFERDIG